MIDDISERHWVDIGKIGGVVAWVRSVDILQIFKDC